MTDQADLATLRLCDRAECDFTVINGVTDLKEILMAMANHIASMYPASVPSNVEEVLGAREIPYGAKQLHYGTEPIQLHGGDHGGEP